MNPWWQNRFDCIQKQCCFLFLGHIFYIQLQELQPSTTHYPDVSRKGTKECSSQMHLSLCILSVRINFGNEKHLYLITLLLKECHSQREFQCLGARERDFFFFFFGCSEWSVGSVCVRVLCFGFLLVGSRPSCWCSADLTESSLRVGWISAIFQREGNLTQHFCP